jgi:putative radical SAM enzyme (TIGR03279 family)
VNDGEALGRTIQDLAAFAEGDWPTVISTAVVPVGLTRFRPANDNLVPVDQAAAIAAIGQVEALQEEFQIRLGSRFAWLADEWYLIAGLPLPPRTDYEDLPQRENGVGSIRGFLEELDQATAQLPTSLAVPQRLSWVVGAVVAGALEPVLERLNRVEGLDLRLYGLPSPYWGQDLVVTGLLTGSDLIQGLQGRDLGGKLLLPKLMLRQGESVFLDDMTLEQLQAQLAVPIQPIGSAEELVAVCTGSTHALD